MPNFSGLPDIELAAGGLANEVFLMPGDDILICEELCLTMPGRAGAITVGADVQGRGSFDPMFQNCLADASLAYPPALPVVPVHPPMSRAYGGVLGPGWHPRCGILVTCYARGAEFHADRDVESTVVAKALPDVPVIGFFSNGEFGPLPEPRIQGLELGDDVRVQTEGGRRVLRWTSELVGYSSVTILLGDSAA